MKLSKKLIVPAFTLLAGVSLVGSISGTIAWYQYSTRANVSYIGSSAGTIGNLQVRLADGEWGTQISYQDVRTYLSNKGFGQKVEPVTPGALAKDDTLKEDRWNPIATAAYGEGAPDNGDGAEGDYYYDSDAGKLYQKGENAWAELDTIDIADAEPANPDLGDKYFNSVDKKLYERVFDHKDFYLNPQVGRGPYSEWFKASKNNYVTFPLQLRFMKGDEDHLTAENVYLSKLLIQKDTKIDVDHAEHGDISEAIRVHFSVYADGDEAHAVNRLVSKQGGTTLTHGKLKLGGGSDFDEGYSGDEFGFEDGSEFGYVNYGGTSGAQNSYSALADQKTGYYYEEEQPANGWDEIPMTHGNSDPNNSVGENGDFYFKTDAEILYQKNAGMWGVFENVFVGSNAPAVDLENTEDKDYYVQKDANKLFKRNLPHSETVSPILAEPVKNSLELDKTTGKSLGKTVATRADNSEPQKYLNVEVTIWVEGWQKFARNDHFTSMWDRDLVGSYFDVGMQFAVQDLNANA